MAERERQPSKLQTRKFKFVTIKQALNTLRQDQHFIASCTFGIKNLIATGGLPENTDMESIVQDGFLSVFSFTKRKGYLKLHVDSKLPRRQQTADRSLWPYLQKVIHNKALERIRKRKSGQEDKNINLDMFDDEHDFGITQEGTDTLAGKFHELSRRDRQRISQDAFSAQNEMVEEASLRERLKKLAERKNLKHLYDLSGLIRLHSPNLSHWVNTLEIVGVLTDLYFINPNPTIKIVQEIYMSEKYIVALMEEWNEDAMRTMMRKKESRWVSAKKSVHRYRARKWLLNHVGREKLISLLEKNTSKTYTDAFLRFIEPQGNTKSFV